MKIVFHRVWFVRTHDLLERQNGGVHGKVFGGKRARAVPAECERRAIRVIRTFYLLVKRHRVHKTSSMRFRMAMLSVFGCGKILIFTTLIILINWTRKRN